MKFVPIVYEHAARFVDKTPWQVSRDAELLFHAHAAAYRCYHHSPVVVGVDIYNLEAEAYGATVAQPDGNNVPTIATPLCPSAEEILQLAKLDAALGGRWAMILAVADRLRQALPGAEVRVPISGPFTIAAQLVGLEKLLFETLDAPAVVSAVLAFLTQRQINLAKVIADRGCKTIIFESAASPPLLSPAMFEETALPALKQLVQAVKAGSDAPPPLIIGGDTLRVLDAILTTGIDYLICPREVDGSAFMKEMAAHPRVTVRINMNPAVFVAGSADKLFQETDRALQLAGNRKNAVIGTGVLSFDADPQSVLEARAYILSKSDCQ